VKDLLAADRYAQALFEIARLTHQDEAFEAELESFSAALEETPALETFFKNPRLSLEEKKKYLVKVYPKRNHEIFETLVNFFMILFKKNRFYLIHEITRHFCRIADEANGRSTAEIRTAVALDLPSEAAIVSRLERMAGTKITVKKEIDSTLIGGVVIKLKNKILDGSVRNRLHLLTQALTQIRSI